MVAARTASFTPELGFALSHESSSMGPGSPPPATAASGKIPSAERALHRVRAGNGARDFRAAFAANSDYSDHCLRVGLRSHLVLRRILPGLMRESQQSDSATRFRYRRESQQC